MSRADLARRAALAPRPCRRWSATCRPRGSSSSPPSPCTRPSAARVGRPPVLIALHRKAGVVAGIDFGKRHLRMAISDLSPRAAGRAPPRARRRPARPGGDRAGQADVRRRARGGRGARARAGRRRHGAARARCTARRASSATPRSCPAGSGSAPRTRSPRRSASAVEVENDANLGALGEWMWGAGRGADHMAYVKAATGIGAGFIVAGAPYVGAGGTAGELGHTVVDPGGPICRCGNRGCLETLRGRARDPQLAARRPRRRPDARRTRSRCALRGDAGCAARDRRRRHARSAPPWPRSATSSIRTGSWSAAISAPPASCCSRRCASRCVRGAIRSAAEDVEVVQGELGDRAEVLGAVALVLGRGAEATTA